MCSKTGMEKTALYTLRNFPFPCDIRDRTPEEVLAEWKTVVKRGVGIQRAEKLVDKAKKSIGIEIGLRFSKK